LKSEVLVMNTLGWVFRSKN